MNTYLNNYLSANAYAMRTLLLSEEIKTKLNNQSDHLQHDIELLKNQLINAEDYLENILKLYSRFKTSNESRYQTVNTVIPLELQQLRVANKLLKQELENALLKKLNPYLPERIQEKNEDKTEYEK